MDFGLCLTPAISHSRLPSRVAPVPCVAHSHYPGPAPLSGLGGRACLKGAATGQLGRGRMHSLPTHTASAGFVRPVCSRGMSLRLCQVSTGELDPLLKNRDGAHASLPLLSAIRDPGCVVGGGAPSLSPLLSQGSETLVSGGLPQVSRGKELQSQHKGLP